MEQAETGDAGKGFDQADVVMPGALALGNQVFQDEGFLLGGPMFLFDSLMFLLYYKKKYGLEIDHAFRFTINKYKLRKINEATRMKVFGKVNTDCMRNVNVYEAQRGAKK